jgi:hypothetical protein
LTCPPLHRFLERLERVLAALELAIGLLKAAVQRPLLQRQDLLQPLFDVLEHGVEIEAVQRLAALLPELLEEVPQPLHPLPQRVAKAPLQ